MVSREVTPAGLRQQRQGAVETLFIQLSCSQSRPDDTVFNVTSEADKNDGFTSSFFSTDQLGQKPHSSSSRANLAWIFFLNTYYRSKTSLEYPYGELSPKKRGVKVILHETTGLSNLTHIPSTKSKRSHQQNKNL